MKVISMRLCLVILSILLYLDGATQGIYPEKTARVLFYNLENMFDTWDDPDKNDDEFTPKGIRAWNVAKLERKIQNISKAVIAAGGWYGADIIGICEIENSYLIECLIKRSPLSKRPYNYIHYNSPDSRGIDVALIYRTDIFHINYSTTYPLFFPDTDRPFSRDILYVKGEIKNESLHLIINHWPSRYGGYQHTINKRKTAALVLRKICDSIFKYEANANILIMGDFNDGPHDESIKNILLEEGKNTNLINLMGSEKFSWKQGSLKYKEKWFTFDQFIISKNLLVKKGLYINDCDAYKGDFLFKEDPNYLGQKPWRTYNGMDYEGGFSDHLPIYCNIICY